MADREQTGLERVAGRTGQAAVSFLSGIPQIELDRLELQNRLIDEQGAALKRQGEAETREAVVQEREVQRQQEIQQLSTIAFDPNNPDKDKALRQLFQKAPEFATEVQKGLRIETQAGLEDAARRAARIQAQPTKELRDTEIRKQINDNPNLDLTETEQLLGMTFEEQEVPLRVTQAAALSTQQQLGLQAGVAEPFALRTFRGLIESAGLEGEEIEEAAGIALGVVPRAVGSAEQTIAVNEQLTEAIAELRETLAERTKFAERTGASRAATIDKGFANIGNINKNIRNIDRAITALEGGASTGAIESRFFPSIRESSVILDQIQGELALDVVGSVTFGALSKGELDLARATALPTNLQPPELITFLQEKRIAQEKLRAYYDSQIQFLDQGGSIAGFLRQQRRNGPVVTEPGGPAEQAPETQAFDPALLEFMTPEEQALFEQ